MANEWRRDSFKKYDAFQCSTVILICCCSFSSFSFSLSQMDLNPQMISATQLCVCECVRCSLYTFILDYFIVYVSTCSISLSLYHSKQIRRYGMKLIINTPFYLFLFPFSIVGSLSSSANEPTCVACTLFRTHTFPYRCIALYKIL